LYETSYKLSISEKQATINSRDNKTNARITRVVKDVSSDENREGRIMTIAGAIKVVAIQAIGSFGRLKYLDAFATSRRFFLSVNKKASLLSFVFRHCHVDTTIIDGMEGFGNYQKRLKWRVTQRM